MSLSLPRRFYTAATVGTEADGHRILLDGRPVRTPGGRPLALPAPDLAAAIAAEWAAQDELIRPASMPMTQLANTALDRVGPQRAQITDLLLGYAGTDLVCFPAESPADLAARQAAAWEPLRAWAAQALGAPLVATTGLVAPAQPAASIGALRAHLDGHDDWRLSAIQAATAAAGSLVIALALAAGRITSAQAVAASQLDELYQAALWGEDAEARDRRAQLAAEIDTAARWLALLAG